MIELRSSSATAPSSRYGLHACQVAVATFCTGGFSSLLL